MPKSLIIVESPTKARTISRFLGADFVVDSSYGHVRDLPKSKLGVDTENDFEPKYVIPVKAKPVIKRLKEEVAKSKRVILATDEDREGESIAWHLTQALGLGNPKSEILNSKQIQNSKIPKSKTNPQVERIVFHEITKKAIDNALKNPREIDEKLVNAQQARRILDRLVGYKLSPFLWKKVFKGLSAGRVQSVAVRLIVEREREIQKFKPEEYWTISAMLSKLGDNLKFEAFLHKKDDKTLDKFDLKNEKDTTSIVERLPKEEWVVEKVEKKSVSKNPLPPFTTSTLQQAAFQRLGFSAKQTMRLAQQLYEGIEVGDGHVGLITYMRTDSLNLSADAVEEAKSFLQKEVGEKYTLPQPRIFKTKTKGAQEAHEAIRPTDPWRTPDSIKNFLDARQFKLYDLIWRRFLATQMPTAIFDATTVDIKAANYTFRANGQILKFDGFLKIYPSKFTENELPEIKPEENLKLMELKPEQHFTEPPARYSEASLIKILEQNGIGRPSTYAPTISTIQDRNYVQKNESRRLAPTETGFLVNDILVEHFPQIVDIQFTAKMEEELDNIAEGTVEWKKIIKEFYIPFAKNLEEKYEEVEKKTVVEETNEICEKCGKPMIIRTGRFGRFMACSGFPDCKNTKPIKEEVLLVGLKCPKCIEGDVIIKRTRRGRNFFGCSNYPKCDFASWKDPRQDKS
ncbi:MAG: type I DNA topoisomerase [bacterium]|nr:type I DNA topoisomerase [bacterium]